MKYQKLVVFSMFFLVCIFSLSFGQDQKQSGRIVGSVIDRANQQPIIGAIVIIEGTAKGASTDLDGKFNIIKVDIGTYILKISCVGYKTLYKSDVVVRTAQPTQINAQLNEEAVKVGNEIVVQGSLFSIPKEVATSAYGLSYEEVRRQAGASGDVSRIIQTMPGVVPTNDQRNDLVVRGGSPDENLTLVDNVEVPNLSHFGGQGSSGGAISMLNTEFIYDANFLAGGFPAQYGGKLSSVLNITLREGNRENFASSFDLSMAGAGLIIESPLGKKGSLMFSGHRSFLDLIFKNFNVEAVPKYSNYQFKSEYNINGNNKIWLVSIGGIDNIRLDYDITKTDSPEFMSIESGGWRVISGINWQSVFNNNGYGILGISDARDNFEQKFRDPQRQEILAFQNKSKEEEITLKYDLVYTFENIGQINAGVSNKFFRLHYDIKTPFGIQNPFNKNPEYVDTLNIDDSYNSIQSSAYLQFTKTVFDQFEFSAGLHYDYFENINEKSTLSPRFSFKYHILPNLNFNASYGIYYQMPPQVFVNTIAQNKQLEPIRADHYIAGFSYFPMPDLKITLEGYYKKYTDYPVSIDYPTYSLANAGDQPTIYGRLIPLTSKGTGRSSGFEVYVQKKLTDQLYGQVSYSYSVTNHKALDGIERPGSFDIPHVLSIIGGFKLNDAWEFSSKFTYSTGKPYTPVDLAASLAQNRTIYDFDNTNSKRMMDYSRLDFRFDYRANFNGWDLVTYLELQNIYNRRNIFTYFYNEKTGKITELKQIAFFPVGGIKIEL